MVRELGVSSTLPSVFIHMPLVWRKCPVGITRKNQDQKGQKAKKRPKRPKRAKGQKRPKIV